MKENTPKNLISVDIQPDHISFSEEKLKRLADLYNNADEIVFIYNGTKMGCSNLDAIKNWLLEIGVKADKFIDFTFLEKEYGFFRDLTDTGISEDLIIKLIKKMFESGYFDINDMADEEVEEILGFYPGSISFYIPELYYDLSDELSGDYTLIGGACDACLKEVEILLGALDINYIKNYHFIY